MYDNLTRTNLEFAHREAEKRITELEKENAELRAKNKWYSEQVCNKECAEVWGNLTKAKEIIKELLDTQSRLDPYRDIFKDRVLKAEQFLKETEG